MTEDKDWQQLGEEWRQNVPALPVAHQEILAEVQRSSKKTRWLAMFSLATATIVMVSLIVLALANRGILTYSFGVIGLSAFLPLCSYLVVYRRNIFPDTLDSGSMLDTLLVQQQAKRDLLEFMRSLLAVETIIATAFWLAQRSLAAWPESLALFTFGSLLVWPVWWEKEKTAAAIQRLQDLRATLK
jgi:hypothetical protein